MSGQLGVLGFGTMGSEIALLGAMAGYQVKVFEPYAEVVAKNSKRLTKVVRILARDAKGFAHESIKDDDARAEVLGRITTGAEMAALAGCSAVIEAVPEIAELKQQLLSELAGHCSEETVLATNTSSISITEIAAGVPNPERVVGMHFFNPPSQMKLVEVIPGLVTNEASVTQAVELAEALGRRVIQVGETPGFVVNRVLIAMMNEAITLHEEGIASIEDIDEAMRLGAGLPMGPFKLADLVGLDVIEHASDVMYKELGRDKFRPPFMLRQHVRAGRLGRKTRHGFYKY